MSVAIPGESFEFFFSERTGENRLHVRKVWQGGFEDNSVGWPLTHDGMLAAGQWATDGRRFVTMPDGYRVTDPTELLPHAI